MRGWCAETWCTRPDPADRYEGKAQLKYFRPKTRRCKRSAGACHLTGKDGWFAFMQYLVIVRKRKVRNAGIRWPDYAPAAAGTRERSGRRQELRWRSRAICLPPLGLNRLKTFGQPRRSDYLSICSRR